MPDSVPPRPKAAVMTASRARSCYPKPPPWCDAGMSGAAEPEAWRAHLAAGLARSPKRRLRTDLTTPSARITRWGGEVSAPGSSPPWRSSASRARKSLAKPVDSLLPMSEQHHYQLSWVGKQTTTFSDVITTVRRCLWEDWVFETTGLKDAFSKLPKPLREMLLTGLAPAA